MSTFARNKAMLEAILAGQSYEECAATHHLGKPATLAAVRHLLMALKEHTDIDIGISTSPDHLRQHKKAILKALKKPIPNTHITDNAKALLKYRFGKYYGGRAKDVTAAWEEIKQNFLAYHESRDLVSIQRWLASEGYFVGDYVTDEMRAFAYEQIGKHNRDMDASDASLRVKIVDTCLDGKNLVFKVELHCKGHVVEKRMELKMLT